MHRRSVLGLGVTLAASALADQPLPAPSPVPAKGGLPSLDGLRELDAYLATLYECADVGERCLVHCIEQLSTGSPALTDCARTVGAVVPSCRALAAAALYGSSEAKAYSALVARLCRACETECKKHAQRHVQCAQCAQACGKCAAACEKMAA